MELLTGGRRWAERDATLRGESDRLARELRDNVLGPRVWHALEPATRTFLASAEAVFRSRRDDPNFDFSGPAVEYAKAVETELNALIFPAAIRFLSCEPLIGEIDFRKVPAWDGKILVGIHWVMAGGESEPEARTMEVAWAQNLVDQSREAGVASFVKHPGTGWAKETAAEAKKGGDLTEWPEGVRIREFPG